MARRKAGDKKGTVKKNRAASEEVNKVQADDHSIAFKELHVGGDVGGDIRIGHTIGYTVEQVSVLLKQITTTLEPKKFDGRCPYKGLEVFEEEDAELFFGRERLVNELVGRVKESRTVFITGPSGSGKSSLVRAGLIHALKQGAIKSSERWLYETMKPGREPLKDLALAFSRLKSPELEDYFLVHATETEILNKCAESVLSGRKDQRFVLFIDQFEEVFTQINSEEERVAFINMLAHAGTAENGRVIVLFAMRSDFVSNCATYPALNELLSQEFRQIGAMQPEELVSAIALPAMHVGLPVEDELIARIINDMRGEPDALPLMQFALKDLFDAKQAAGGAIALTLKDYLQHGGIHKSLERHADATFGKLSENEQELTRSIFSGLIEIGRGTQDTKRTALFDELIPANTRPEEVSIIVQKLADARLIITDEQAGKDTVTISHEKLIEAWPWLKKLVNENRDVIALQNEIASDAEEWEEHQRESSYLYSGARLANAYEQVAAKKLTLSGLAHEFVQAGRSQQELGRKQQQRRLTILWIATIAALVIMSFLSLYAIQQANNAKEQANIALARQLAAQAQSINATSNSQQLIAALLAVQSMNMFPSNGAAQILLNNNDAGRPISFMNQGGEVNSVAFSPDGKYVVSGGCSDITGSYDTCKGSIRVWEATSGKEVTQVNTDNIVASVNFSSDGRFVVSGGCDEIAFDNFTCVKGSIHVWEALTGKEVAHMTHNGNNSNNRVASVEFSQDGKRVLSGSWDGTARVWELATGQEVARITHDSSVSSGVFNPDGKYVISGSWDQTARVWDAATGVEVARMTHDGPVNSVTFSPDGKYVASGSNDGTARVWDAATGEEVARMTHDNLVDTVAFSPDGKYVISGSWDQTARVWEAVTGKEIARMTHDSGVTSVAFSHDSKHVVSGSWDHTARAWDVATGKEIARMTHDDIVWSVAFSPNGKDVVSGSWDRTTRVWETVRAMIDMLASSMRFSSDSKYVFSGGCDIADQVGACIQGSSHVWEVSTGKEVAHKIHDTQVMSVAFSPDGIYVVSGNGDGTVRVWEASTDKEVARMMHEGVTFVAFSPNGKYVVSGGYSKGAYVWEALTGKEIAHLTYDHRSKSVVFSPDSKYLSVSGSSDGTARVWEVATGTEIARMTHEYWINDVTFSPNGRYVLSGGEDGTARVWEAASGNEIARVTHDTEVTSVAFSWDGKYVASGGADKTIRVWESMTGREIIRMAHDALVTSITFSADGAYLASGSWDNTARVWEVATGKEIARMTHDAEVTLIAFSPDDKNIISTSKDNNTRLWLWHPNDLVVEACSRLSRNLTRLEWTQYLDNEPFEAVCPNLPIEDMTTETQNATQSLSETRPPPARSTPTLVR